MDASSDAAGRRAPGVVGSARVMVWGASIVRSSGNLPGVEAMYAEPVFVEVPGR